MYKRMTILTVLVAMGCVATRSLNSLSRPQHRLGVTHGRLADCPDRPNCVSSTASRPSQQLPPIPLTTSPPTAMEILASVVKANPRSRIVTQSDHYLHAEFRSRILGFVDDVEFLVDETNSVIQFRSASRVGYSDLGVNRRRMNELRDQVTVAQQQAR